MHQLTPAVLMLTTNIFPDEDKPIKVFIENQNQPKIQMHKIKNLLST